MSMPPDLNTGIKTEPGAAQLAILPSISLSLSLSHTHTHTHTISPTTHTHSFSPTDHCHTYTQLLSHWPLSHIHTASLPLTTVTHTHSFSPTDHCHTYTQITIQQKIYPEYSVYFFATLTGTKAYTKINFGTIGKCKAQTQWWMYKVSYKNKPEIMTKLHRACARIRTFLHTPSRKHLCGILFPRFTIKQHQDREREQRERLLQAWHVILFQSSCKLFFIVCIVVFFNCQHISGAVVSIWEWWTLAWRSLKTKGDHLITSGGHSSEGR